MAKTTTPRTKYDYSRCTEKAYRKLAREYDAIGAAAFHTKYGTAPSPKCVLMIDGKSYPSKAFTSILIGVSPSDFTGGFAGPVARGAKRAGVILTKVGALLGAAFTALTGVAHADLPTADTGAAIYFASGSSRPGDIRGFARIGHGIGVAAPEIRTKSETELKNIAGSGVPVFVDSGAFSEIKFNVRHVCKAAQKCARGECIGDGELPRDDVPEGAPYTHAPITDAEWQKRLDLYARLAAAYNFAGAACDLYLVAPDKVAFQAETLRRLRKYAPEMRALRDLGVNLLVVAQQGELTQAEFDATACDILGFSDFVRALPCKKDATSVEAVRDFCAKVQPKRLHLLGLGIRNANYDRYLAAVASVSPDTVVSCDSNMITANVGRKRDGVRPLTAARDLAEKLIAAGKTAITDTQELGIILAFGAGFASGLLGA